MGRLVAACFALFLTACQGVQHNTASGRPEVTVGTKADAVRPVIISEMINMGYSVTRDTPTMIIFEQPSKSVMTNVLLGSQWNPTINFRMTFTMVEIGPNTRIVADIAGVTNPGTGFEQLTPMTNNADSAKLQTWLNFFSEKYPPKPTT